MLSHIEVQFFNLLNIVRKCNPLLHIQHRYSSIAPTTTKVFMQNSLDMNALPNHMDRVKRIWYLLPMRAANVQASLRICAVSPESSLLAHTSSESRGTFRQKARSLAPLNGWVCAVEICHDGMLEDTNSLDRAHTEQEFILSILTKYRIKQSGVARPFSDSIYMH